METKTVTNTQLYNSPYKNNIISCYEMLKPYQMKNEYDLFLKQNISNRLVGKCYKDYGYICKIYKILEEEQCELEDENTSGSAKIHLKIACKVCLPAKNTEIICKVKRSNKEIYGVVNGPIIFIIEHGNIDTNNFYIDMNRNIRSATSSKILSDDMYVKVMVDKMNVSDNEKNIISYGVLLNIATENEIKMFEAELKSINDINEEYEKI
jgi:DNA-directed RNA polymerase subunit E'/Rpb7